MLTLEEYEKLNPRCEITHEGTRVLFATPTVFTKWRVDSLFQKEPITKDPNFTCPGGPHHPFECFLRVATMPYLPNTLFAFLKTHNSFHGVEPIKEAGIRRDLLLYDIKVQDPPELRRQAPAATQPAAAPVSNFTF